MIANKIDIMHEIIRHFIEGRSASSTPQNSHRRGSTIYLLQLDWPYSLVLGCLDKLQR